MRKSLLLLGFCLLAGQSFAQSNYNEKVAAYVARFKDIAVSEQQRTGIPAAIKLAQGLFETGAGESELCTQANNHFGIKCKSSWTGPTYSYTDDAKDECFRRYNDEWQSYKDHSDFLLQNKRYQPLFKFPVTDYAAWAQGLKTCGYATNPQYARRLVKLIEDYHLQEYTYLAMNMPKEEGDLLLASAEPLGIPQPPLSFATAQQEITPVAESTDEEVEQPLLEPVGAGQVVTNYYQSTTKNGKKGFYARKGDLLLEFAIKNKIRYSKLLEMNDLPDAPLEADMFIYLEKKSRVGLKEKHLVRKGETLLQISQHEGIQLAQLRELNLLERDEEPLAGAVLQLQRKVSQRPEVTKQGASKTTLKENTAHADKKQVARPELIATTKAPVQEALPEDKQIEPGIEAPYEVEDAVAGESPVNIADEPAIEELLANDKANNNTPDRQLQEKPLRTTVVKEDASSPKKEEEMSPLDKLKAHMDKTVYAQKEQAQASSVPTKAPAGSAVQDTYTTVPARKMAGTTTSTANQHQPRSAAAKTTYHTVVKGDTAFSISKKYGITVSQLQQWNKLSSSNVPLGKRLRVVAP